MRKIMATKELITFGDLQEAIDGIPDSEQIVSRILGQLGLYMVTWELTREDPLYIDALEVAVRDRKEPKFIVHTLEPIKLMAGDDAEALIPSR